MDTVLANPQNLTWLGLLGLMVIQGAQLLRGRQEASASREARHDDHLMAIFQKMLDQHSESMARQAISLERVAASMAEIQAHMHATNTALGNLTHRLELVERQLAGDVPYPAVGGRGPQLPAVLGGGPR